MATLTRFDLSEAVQRATWFSHAEARIRERWPKVRFLVRGDSGFCRESIMRWCESNDVDYVLGLLATSAWRGGSARPCTSPTAAMWRRARHHGGSGVSLPEPRISWSRARRVVAKAEHLAKGSNPRFVVTSLGHEVAGSQRLYEKLYCARGDMENRIKERQLDLFAGCHSRQSTHTRMNSPPSPRCCAAGRPVRHPCSRAPRAAHTGRHPRRGWLAPEQRSLAMITPPKCPFRLSSQTSAVQVEHTRNRSTGQLTPSRDKNTPDRLRSTDSAKLVTDAG